MGSRKACTRGKEYEAQTGRQVFPVRINLRNELSGQVRLQTQMRNVLSGAY